MTAPDGSSPSQPGPPPPPDVTRWALLAAVGIFLLAFFTMLVLAGSDQRSEAQAAVFDTCKWLSGLTAMAIIGLIRR